MVMYKIFRALILAGALSIIATLSKGQEQTSTENDSPFEKCRTSFCNNGIALTTVQGYNRHCRNLFEELCEYGYPLAENQKKNDKCLRRLCQDNNPFLLSINCFDFNYHSDCRVLIDELCIDYKTRSKHSITKDKE